MARNFLMAQDLAKFTAEAPRARGSPCLASEHDNRLHLLPLEIDRCSSSSGPKMTMIAQPKLILVLNRG